MDLFKIKTKKRTNLVNQEPINPLLHFRIELNPNRRIQRILVKEEIKSNRFKEKWSDEPRPERHCH